MLNTPNLFDKWNRAHQGAFKKGYAAFASGVAADQCPYDDKRKDNNRLTWSRSFSAAWRDGWLWAKSGN
jgi:ribosome modulation factor